MRFASTAKPSLTPLGHRLLHLSEAKLANLDTPLGGRDEATALWKGVVISQAVRSAWKSVDEGLVGDITDWHHKGAMGLDIIGEDEEEEEDEDDESPMAARGEERWFEDLISNLGEDDYSYTDSIANHEWTESSVASPDDIEYDDASIEAFTFPSTSPPLAPQYAPVSQNLAPPTVNVDTVTEVEVVEVDDDDVEELWVNPEYHLNHHHERHVPLQPILTPLSVPITPTSSPTGLSPSPSDSYYDDLDECVDEFMLPPPLHRSLSSSSYSSLDDEENVCVTPPSYSCEELEEEAPVVSGYEMTKRAFGDGWLGLDLGSVEVV